MDWSCKAQIKRKMTKYTIVESHEWHHTHAIRSPFFYKTKCMILCRFALSFGVMPFLVTLFESSKYLCKSTHFITRPAHTAFGDIHTPKLNSRECNFIFETRKKNQTFEHYSNKCHRLCRTGSCIARQISSSSLSKTNPIAKLHVKPSNADEAHICVWKKKHTNRFRAIDQAIICSAAAQLTTI